MSRIAWHPPRIYTCTTNCTGETMQTISFSDARNNLKHVLDRVANDRDITLITRRNGEDAVVMSLDTYNSLTETLHLLKTPANAAHLQRSIAQYQNGQSAPQELADD